VLGYLAAAGAEHYFTWVLVPALLSDIADGFIARRFGLTSRLGALLDSIGDTLLFFVALFGVWAFYPELLQAHAVAGLMLIGSWIVEIAVALIRYRRLSSFHTYLSKAAAYLLGISIGVLFLWGLPAALLYVAVTASVVANLEELALMWLLPQWRPNVRGLYWVLQERRRSSR
jgi:cardiolipin synthase (CMP-forming)